MRNKLFVVSFLAIAFLGFSNMSSGGNEGAETAGHGDYTFLLWIAILLAIAGLGRLIEKIKQPSVLGELIAGLLLGAPVLIGFHYFEAIKESEIIKAIVELGVVVLLFQAGLESKISEMRENAGRALIVAVLGVAAPFALGYFVSPMLIPGLSSEAALFLGATLTATSVGITARVFRDLNKIQTSEAKIILGAAVFDDIIGLIILSIVSAIVVTGTAELQDVVLTVAKALGFLLIAVVVLRPLTPRISIAFSKINTGIGMKFVLAMFFCLMLSYIASLIGLAPIVGAFAAGLILEPVHFKFFKEPEIIDELKEAIQEIKQGINKHASQVTERLAFNLGFNGRQGILSVGRNAIGEAEKKISKIIKDNSERHVDALLEPIAYFTVPIFFVVTGMKVDLSTLSNGDILLAGALITAIAFLGKIVSGVVMLVNVDLNKIWRGLSSFSIADVFSCASIDTKNMKSAGIVGVGMIPRGEVGLIFAAIGQAIGVITDEVFSVVIIMVMVSTLVTPVFLGLLLKEKHRQS